MDLFRTAISAVAIAAVLCFPCASALADGVPIEDANPAQLRAAQKTFEAADELYDGQQYEAAIKAYRTSFEIVASPNSRLMIGRSMQKLGNLPGAYAELETAVSLAERAAAKDPKYEPTLKAARDELASLKSKVGIVHLRFARVIPGTSLSVGGQPVDLSTLSRPVILSPGKVPIVARAEGYSELRRELSVKEGQETNVDLELTPSSRENDASPPPATTADVAPSNAPLRTAAFVAGGVGAVGFVGFAIFGAMHLSKYSDLEDKCPNKQCSRDLQSDIDSGRTLEMLANVGLVVGIVGVGAGVTLLALSAKKSAKPPSTSAFSSFAVGPGSLRVVGRF